MKKNQIKLPSRKWYSLQQAADKLTREFGVPITIDDLLHYYQIDLLPFSIYIERYPSQTLIGDLVFSDSPKQVNSMPKNMLKFYMLSKLDELIIGNILYIEPSQKEQEIESVISNNQILKTRIITEGENNTFTINGFMNIYSDVGFSPLDIENLKKDGINLSKLNYLISPSHDDGPRAVINVSVLSDEHIYLSINNLYILDHDLNEFIDGKSIGSVNKVIEAQRNISPRKEANKTEFIRALLKTHYGTDDPNECRKLLYNGKLSRDFTRAKIDPDIITPETLRNWLKAEK